MKKTLLSLLFLAITSYTALAQSDTVRVLFIGNSFTAVFDVPALVKGFADQAGFPLEYRTHAPGGVSVGDISQGPMAHMMNPQVFDMIRQEKWDFVVLQDNQGRFIYGNGVFPSTSTSKVLEGHQKIRDSLVANHPCAKMLWFAGWAFKNGYPGIGNTGIELIENIYENYQFLNQQTPEIIAPIGLAWARAMQVIPPHVNLWGPDDAHQSEFGSYLTAAVIFSSIYRRNTETVEFNSTLDTTVTKTLRRVAYQTVMDSIQATGLQKITTGLKLVGNMLIADTGFKAYTWYKDSLQIATTTTNTYSVTKPGTYQLLATNKAGCRVRSQTLLVIPSSGVPGAPWTSYYIGPQPATNYLSIQTGSGQAMPLEIRVSDLSGKTLLRHSSLAASAMLDVSHLSAGLYLVQINGAGQQYSYRMLKADR